MDMIGIDEARNLVADAALWPRIRDFLWDFAPQVHGSWLEDLERETLDERRENETVMSHVSRLMSSPRVKRFVLDSLGVEPCFHAFPKNDWSRLLLLDGATLESIVKWLGAISCAESLRRVTDGKVVRELKVAFPGVYPDVLGYTMYFKDVAAKNAEDAKSVIVAGLEILREIVADLDFALKSRLKLKLPKDFCALCDLCGKEEAESVESSVVAKLLKLKFPEGYSLCC